MTNNKISDNEKEGLVEKKYDKDEQESNDSNEKIASKPNNQEKSIEDNNVSQDSLNETNSGNEGPSKNNSSQDIESPKKHEEITEAKEDSDDDTFKIFTHEDFEDDTKENYDDIDLSRLEQMDDDEAIIELDKMTGKNDDVLEKDYLSSLISQNDRLIYYEVENIYNNPKKRTFRNRLKMRKDPPVLVIRDDFENEAKFYLTENLTDELSETLRQVKRAYYGFNNPSDLNMPEKFIDRVKYYIKSNPFKVLSTILLILFILSLSM